MADFIPPVDNSFLFPLARRFLPVAYWWGCYDGVDVDESSAAILRSLSGKRAVLCPNHSHAHDPGFMFALQFWGADRFRFVAAREIFDWWHGVLGWLLSRLGAYSVARRRVDRRSLTTTLSVLLNGQYKLVVFPEAEISYRNDRLLRLQDGLVSLLLRAADTLSATSPGEPLYVVPTAIMYRYCEDISARLSNALLRIEQRLGIAARPGSLSVRFRRARRALLQVAAAGTGKRRQGSNSRLKALRTFDDIQILSPELMASGVDLIEREMFGRVTEKGRRRAIIRLGEPIEITHMVDAYRLDRKSQAAHLGRQLHEQLANLLGIRRPEPAFLEEEADQAKAG